MLQTILFCSAECIPSLSCFLPINFKQQFSISGVHHKSLVSQSHKGLLTLMYCISQRNKAIEEIKRNYLDIYNLYPVQVFGFSNIYKLIQDVLEIYSINFPILSMFEEQEKRFSLALLYKFQRHFL